MRVLEMFPFTERRYGVLYLLDETPVSMINTLQPSKSQRRYTVYMSKKAQKKGQKLCS